MDSEYARGLSIIDQMVVGLRNGDPEALTEAKCILQYIVDHGGCDELYSVFRGMSIQNDLIEDIRSKNGPMK